MSDPCGFQPTLATPRAAMDAAYEAFGVSFHTPVVSTLAATSGEAPGVAEYSLAARSSSACSIEPTMESNVDDGEPAPSQRRRIPSQRVTFIQETLQPSPSSCLHAEASCQSAAASQQPAAIPTIETLVARFTAFFLSIGVGGQKTNNPGPDPHKTHSIPMCSACSN